MIIVDILFIALSVIIVSLILNSPIGLAFILLLMLGYLFGSIPSGLIFAKFFKLGDIRTIGSGNIGATNVLRTGNKKAAIATLAGDMGKIAIPLLIYYLIGTSLPESNVNHPLYIPFKDIFPLIATGLTLGAVLGHCYPVWLKFKGGKGVATALGGLLVALPYTGILMCLSWLIAAKLSKISSLSALISFFLAPFATLFLYGSNHAQACLLISLFVFYRHKENIKRLLNGSEPKIGAKKKEENAGSVSQ